MAIKTKLNISDGQMNIDKCRLVEYSTISQKIILESKHKLYRRNFVKHSIWYRLSTYLDFNYKETLPITSF